MLQTPLHSLYIHGGVKLIEASGYSLPNFFSSSDKEYIGAHTQAVITDRSYLGRIVLNGPDALDLLNRLSTNQLDYLPPGTGATTAITTNKGRLIDWVTVLQSENNVIVLTSAGRSKLVTDWIDKYTIVEEITTLNLTDSTAMIGVVGPMATDVLLSIFGSTVQLDRYGSTEVTWRDQPVVILRTDPFGLPNYDVIVDASHAEILWAQLLDANIENPAIPMGAATSEILRVEAGVPLWGRELTESRNPLEAGLAGSISWTKGCYIGQEVVARLKTYDKVQRYLVGFSMDSDLTIEHATSLILNGTKVGFVTSTCQSPSSRKTIGIAYIQPSLAQEGVSVFIELNSGEMAKATIQWTSESSGYVGVTSEP